MNDYPTKSQVVASMESIIPDDVMKSATEAASSSRAEMYEPALRTIARAIMAERERCAKVCDGMAYLWEAVDGDPSVLASYYRGQNAAFEAAAAAIRKGEA